MKRILSVCMLLTLIFPNIENVCAADLADDNPEIEYKVVWDEDFDSTDKNHKFFSTTEFNVQLEKYDESHGKSAKIEIKDNSWPAFNYNFEEPVSDGILYIGYDLLRTENGRAYDAFLMNTNSSWGNGLFIGTIWAGNNGVISYFENCHIDAIRKALPGSTMPQGNSWHRVESWLDLDNRIATYYVDGQLIGTTPVSEELQQISAYRRNDECNYGTGLEYMDNFQILHFEEIGREIDLDFIEAVPEYLEQPVNISFETEVLGQSFFEEKASFKVLAKNMMKYDVSGLMNVEAVNESGNAVFTEQREIAVKSKEEAEESFEFSFETYGTYTIKASVEIPENKTSYGETTFVYLKEAEKQNPTLGYSSHSYWGYGTDELDRKQQMLAKAGFSFHREEFFWTYYAHRDGTFGFDEKMNNILDTTFGNNLKPLVILAGWGGRTDLTEDEVPRSDWSRNNFRNYVSGVATELKGKVAYYEVFNETTLKDDPDTYVAAQKVAYEAVKAADPDARVLCGATARVPLEWIELLLSHGAGEYFDAFSCHPYTIENLPEEGGSYGTAEKMVRGLRELLDKYDLQDKEIVISELSYTAANLYATETQQAAFGLRQYMMVQPYVETFIWYNDQNKTAAGTSGVEANFGLIRSWQNDGISYQAKPVLVSWAAFNSLLCGAENLGRVETKDDNVWIYKFKASDGKDVLAVWNSDNEVIPVSLNLGAETAQMFDMYGNESNIYADNGAFNVEISENILYLKGNFDEVVQNDSQYLIKQNSLQLIRGEEFSVHIDKLPQNTDFEIKVECPDNITCNSVSKEEITFVSGFDAEEKEKITINFTVDGKKVFSHVITVEYIQPVTYTCELLPYNTQRYQAIIKLKNERNTDVSAELTVSEPAILSGKTYKINIINPKNERTIKINVPLNEAEKGEVVISGEVKLNGSTGEESIPLNITKKVGCLKYDVNKKPQIDGVISEGEWDEFLPMNINRKDMAQQKVWGGLDDVSATIYTMCDSENFYLAAEVTDDVHYDKDTPDRVWAVDSIQMAIALYRQSGSPSTEIGLGIANGEVTLQSYLSQYVGGGKATDDSDFSENTLYAVKRYEEEKKTVYELQLPWSDIYAEKTDISKQKEIYFSVLVNDNDGNGRGWLEYCGGIGTSKNPEQFMELPIYKVR